MKLGAKMDKLPEKIGTYLWVIRYDSGDKSISTITVHYREREFKYGVSWAAGYFTNCGGKHISHFSGEFYEVIEEVE